MAFGTPIMSITLEDILTKVTESDLVFHYLGVTKIPTLINSPLRVDNKPSLGLYSTNGKKINYIDFSNKDRGGLFDLFGKMWNCSYLQTLERIYNDIPNISISNNNIKSNPNSKKNCIILSNDTYKSNSDLQCKIREWEDYDIEYWNSFGISLKWLKYAEVYPISHKIVIKDGKQYSFKADKYAYAYVERKENKITLKIYQPFNTKGFKWSNKHDKSVISLWTKIPLKGDKLCICSSLKDALCLWSNTNIPAIAIQGEGYGISETALKELRNRYNKIYILLDNDKVGIEDSIKLAEETGFTNLILPTEQKDISDAYKALGKEQFLQTILKLFNND